MEVVYTRMNSSETTINLPRHIYLENMGCALFEMKGQIKPSTDSLFLCADFIQESSVGSHILTVLRRLDVDEEGFINKAYDRLLYLPCNGKYISDIKLFITDEQGHIPSFNNCHLDCTLLFIDNVHSL